MIVFNKVDKYRVFDKLFFHHRDDSCLIVSRTPPAWCITNGIGGRIAAKLPTTSPESVDDIAKRIESEGISRDSALVYIRELIGCGILLSDREVPEQTDRPLSIHGAYIEITNNCNLSCKHCYVDAHNSSNKNHLSKEMILKVVHQLPSHSEIGISGGEPLMRSDCLEIVKEVVQSGYKCSLLTNGILIDHTIAQQLAEMKITVQISLEGPNALINDAIRGEGSFQRAIDAVRILLLYSAIVRISFTPTKVNWRTFEQFVELMLAEGVNSIHVCTYTPQGRGYLNQDSLMLNDEELMEFQLCVEKAKQRISIMGNLPETLDIERVGYLWDKCPLGGSIHVGYDGSIYPCEIAANKKMVIGNVKNMTLLDALNSEKGRGYVKQSQDRIVQQSECSLCEWKHFCGGGCLVLAIAKDETMSSVDYLCSSRKKWFEQLLWEKSKL